jgi:hypothetical protein
VVHGYLAIEDQRPRREYGDRGDDVRNRSVWSPRPCRLTSRIQPAHSWNTGIRNPSTFSS